MLKTASTIALAATCFVSFPARADEFQVKERKRGPTGFFVFAPELVRIKPGDTIDFIASDKGHDVHSVNGMIPVNIDRIDPSSLPAKAKVKIQTLLDQIKHG